jgi:hemerythrin-like metal-binding protein
MNRPPQAAPDTAEDDVLHQIEQRLAQEMAAHQQTNKLLYSTVLAYGRFVPQQFLQLLNINSIVDIKLGDQAERRMTVMFSDIRNFTTLSESMTPRENFNFLNSYLSQMEPLITKHHGFIDKYIGDAIMALFPREPDDALRGAIAMLDKLAEYNAGRKRAGYLPIQIGIGLNAGMVMLGTVGGDKRMDSTVISDAVNLASRLEEMTKVYLTPLLLGEHTLYSLADTSRYCIRFVDRIRVKGRSSPISVYEVFDNDEPALKQGKLATREKFEDALAYYHMRDPHNALQLLEECLKVAPDDPVAKIYIDRCMDRRSAGAQATLGEPMGWKDEFLVGHDELDLQHKYLLSCMNQLIGAIQRNDGHEAHEAAANLAWQADTLFRLEEDLMQRQDYPFLDDHMHEHRKFREYFTAFRDRIEAGSPDPTILLFRAQLLLLDWFANHTTRSDRHLGRYLAAASQS